MGEQSVTKPLLKGFISYSHADEVFRQKLGRHLVNLQKDGSIIFWHDREIVPGEQWDKKIDENLASADIVLVLVSSDYLSSEYCDKECKQALYRHKAGEAVVIPIILRSAEWTKTDLKDLQALPKDGKPVNKWEPEDDAFLDIVKGIRRVIAERLKRTASSKPFQPDNRRIPQLVDLKPEPGKFGGREIKYAAIFALMIAAVNIAQRVVLSKSKTESQAEALSLIDGIWLNLSMGVSVFFLTSAVLLFLSYESAKISMFIRGVTSKITFWYVFSLCFVIVASHADSFIPNKAVIMIIGQIMLFAVCIIETMIDLKLAACFERISDHFGTQADIFKQAAKYAIIIFFANLVLAGLSVSSHVVGDSPVNFAQQRWWLSWLDWIRAFLSWVKRYDWVFLVGLFVANYIVLWVVRTRLEKAESERKGLKSDVQNLPA